MTPFTIGAVDHAERTYGLLVSGNDFRGLGLRPALGRFPHEDEVARAGAAAVAVISYGYWETRFARSNDVIGQTLRVNERPLTIIGVAPSGFQGTVLGLDFDLWVPATMAPVLLGASRELEDRGIRGYSLMGRLAPQATLARAQGEADAAMRELALRYPEANAGMRAEVRPFWRAPRAQSRSRSSSPASLRSPRCRGTTWRSSATDSGRSPAARRFPAQAGARTARIRP